MYLRHSLLVVFDIRESRGHDRAIKRMLSWLLLSAIDFVRRNIKFDVSGLAFPHLAPTLFPSFDVASSTLQHNNTNHLNLLGMGIN